MTYPLQIRYLHSLVPANQHSNCSLLAHCTQVGHPSTETREGEIRIIILQHCDVLGGNLATIMKPDYNSCMLLHDITCGQWEPDTSGNLCPMGTCGQWEPVTSGNLWPMGTCGQWEPVANGDGNCGYNSSTDGSMYNLCCANS